MAILVLAAMAAAPMPMWGQWNGTNPVWTNSNVGIGVTSITQPYTGFGQIELRGSTQGGLYQLSTSAPDADHNQIGQIMWLDKNSTNGDKSVAQIYAFQSGPTANNRGSFLGFGTKPDNGSYIVTRMLIDRDGNVGIGTTNPQYLLSVKGTVGAQEFIVTNTGWSDYVFRPDYRLRPLSEVSQYIQENGHLPDIPTEAEVKEKGVSIGDMQAKLLAKVEELTLHMIQQEKDNRELRDKMNEQTKEIQDLRERLAKSAATDSTPAVAK